ncbi:MAG: hypothetical protein ACK5NC_05240 [Vibrio sp.]
MQVAIQQIPNKRVRARLIAHQSVIARNIVSNTFSVYVLDKTENPHLYTLDGERKRIGKQEALAMNQHSCEWTISMLLIATESNGKRKILLHDTTSPVQCKFTQLIGSVADNIIEIAREYPYQENIESVGWIASYRNEMPESMAYKILEKLGAWND